MNRHESRIDVRGGDLAVVDYGGTGPEVLLLHSVCHSCAIWDDVAPLLTPHAHVITFDLRGHGQSSADVEGVDDIPRDIADVVRALKLTRPLLVGHDVAGGFAAAVAAYDPGSVGGLVVIDSPVVESRDAVRDMVRMVGAEAMAAMLVQRFGLGDTGPDAASRESFIAEHASRNPHDLLSAAPDDERARVLLARSIVVAADGSWTHRPTHDTVRALTRDPDAATFQPGRELLAEIDLPVTVVTLTDGRNGCGGEAMDELAASRADLRVVRVDSGPHALHLAAEPVAQAILSTLERRTAATDH